GLAGLGLRPLPFRLGLAGRLLPPLGFRLRLTGFGLGLLLAFGLGLGRLAGLGLGCLLGPRRLRPRPAFRVLLGLRLPLRGRLDLTRLLRLPSRMFADQTLHRGLAQAVLRGLGEQGLGRFLQARQQAPLLLRRVLLLSLHEQTVAVAVVAIGRIDLEARLLAQ